MIIAEPSVRVGALLAARFPKEAEGTRGAVRGGHVRSTPHSRGVGLARTRPRTRLPLTAKPMTRANFAPAPRALFGAVRSKVPANTLVACVALPEPTKNVVVAAARHVGGTRAVASALEAVDLDTLRVTQTPSPSLCTHYAPHPRPVTLFYTLKTCARGINLADTAPIAR